MQRWAHESKPMVSPVLPSWSKTVGVARGLLLHDGKTVKDRNGMDLIEAEDTKKRWQEYTEELYKKDLNNPDNHDGVITHLEPDILELKSSGV